MRQTKQREADRKLAVTADELAGMLSCGEATARRIGEDAKARVTVGRRVLYCVAKVEDYLYKVSD